jgi:hypothetical protein
MSSTVFAQNLKKIVDEIMTLEVLEELSSVNKSTISRIISNPDIKPYAKTKAKIATGLKLDLEYLDNNLLSDKDMHMLDVSPTAAYELSWSDNDKDILSRYIVKEKKSHAKTFTLKVDEAHSSMVASEDATLEFSSQTAFEDDFIAYIKDDKNIETAKVLKAKRKYYVVLSLSDDQEYKITHNQIIGVLKNIHL